MGLIPAGKFSKYLGKLKGFFKFEKAADRTLRITNEILKDAKLTKITSKGLKNFTKEGNFNDALKDFSKYKFKKVEAKFDKNGNLKAKIGYTKANKIINVRTTSKEGSPTLEIARYTDKGNYKSEIKIRYHEE